MGDIQIFNNYEFGQVRTVIIDNDPWFVGRDVAEALGYSNTRDALLKHVDDDDKAIFKGSDLRPLEDNIPNRGLTIINESGVYSLIFGSKLPNAKKFKHWVTSEVLPAIRETGQYSKALTPAEMLLKQAEMMVAQEKKMLILEHNQDELKETTQNIDDRLQQIETSIGTASGYLAVATYLSRIGIKQTKDMSRWMGMQASKLCKARGLGVGKIPVDNQIYTSVNTYPIDVLEEIYQEYVLSH